MKRLLYSCLLLMLLCVSVCAQTNPGSVYPGSVDARANLGETANNVFTTLAAPMTSSQTTVSLINASRFPDSGFITIGQEISSYSAKSGNTLSGLIRGEDGTTASAHVAGNPVEMRIVSKLFKIHADAIIALETKLAAGADINATKLQGRSIANAAPGDGDRLIWSASNDRWQPTAIGTGITILNGLSGFSQTFVTGTTGSDFNITSAGTAHTFNLPTASASNRGLLSASDWAAFTAKQAALGFIAVPNTRMVNAHSLASDVTISKSDVGLGNVPNVDATAPANITQDATHRFATDAEKSTWNGKQDALGFTPENTANRRTTFQVTPDDTHYPSEKLVKDSLDSKQSAGNYVTGLTGDGAASGPGSVALTLAIVNANVGSFGGATKSLSITANGKGLITAISEQAIAITESQVTNLVTDLAAKLVAASNLSDVANAGTARTNLGLGTLATQNGTFSGTSSGTNTGDQDLSGYVPATRAVNGHPLSANVTVSASDVGLGNVANSLQLIAASNLSDVTNAGTARTNLGLGSMATQASSAVSITGGTAAGLTGFGIRSTGAAFDLTLATSEVLTAGRTLSFILGDAARSLTIGASASVSGTNTGDQTSVTGNAGTATALQNVRTINGTNFDGTANITITAAPNAAINLAASGAGGVTGTLSLGNGGFGITSGTSGGVPYFNSGSTLASSAALTANLPVIGGGAGAAPTVGTRSGNTTQFVTTTGTLTSGDCVKIDASGNFIAFGSACGGGGGITIGTTTITGGTDTKSLFNNAGVVGERTVTGTGNAVLSASPTLTGTVGLAALTATGTIVQTSASATAFESGPNGGTNPVFRLVNNTASQASGISIIGNAAGAGVTIQVISSNASEDLQLFPKSSGNVVSHRSFNTDVAGQAYIAGTDNNTYNIGVIGGSNPFLKLNSTGVIAYGNSGNAGSTLDAGISRISSGLLGLGNGTQGSFAGSIKLTDIFTNNASFLHRTNTTITGGATGNVPTLTAGPVSGNPTKWIPIDDNGVTRYIPAW